jgi:hypothetical protein
MSKTFPNGGPKHGDFKRQHVHPIIAARVMASLFQGTPVRNDSPGYPKSYYRMSILRKMEAIMLQNGALWIAAQHFDTVDQEGATLSWAALIVSVARLAETCWGAFISA